MTVTAIQIGLDPDVIDYSSADFAQFPRLVEGKAARPPIDEKRGQACAPPAYHVDNCLIDFGAGRRRQGPANGWRPSATTRC